MTNSIQAALPDKSPQWGTLSTSDSRDAKSLREIGVNLRSQGISFNKVKRVFYFPLLLIQDQPCHGFAHGIEIGGYYGYAKQFLQWGIIIGDDSNIPAQHIFIITDLLYQVHQVGFLYGDKQISLPEDDVIAYLIQNFKFQGILNTKFSKPVQN